jgi:hypothetical protein
MGKDGEFVCTRFYIVKFDAQGNKIDEQIKKKNVSNLN